MPIYTKTGDKGQTSLFDGTRVLKNNVRVDAYGTVDELNSMIGNAIAHLKKGKSMAIHRELINIQHDLLDIGSGLAMPGGMPVIGLEERVTHFERMIDDLTSALPPLHNFVLPGGSQAGAMLHVARTIARRAERKIVGLMQGEQVDELIVKYINRLSDLLFTMARHVNFDEKYKDVVWIKK
jgi:cob(I)alamin adenosyltransferase